MPSTQNRDRYRQLSWCLVQGVWCNSGVRQQLCVQSLQGQQVFLLLQLLQGASMHVCIC